MPGIDVESPLVYVFINIVVWVVTVGTIQMVFLDGSAIDGVITGTLGGLAFGTTSLYLRRREGSSDTGRQND